jgi:hypothetical protein
MSTQAPVKNRFSKSAFPLEAVRALLRKELEEAEEESATLHEAWEPVLDSLRMVSVLIALEGIFDFPLPPERVIRKGGYESVDKGVDDMAGNLHGLWQKHHQSGG